MKTYTIEITELVPNFAHVTVEAETLAEAIEKAKAYDGDQWRLDWECVRPTEVTGAWEGEEDYGGPALDTNGNRVGQMTLATE